MIQRIQIATVESSGEMSEDVLKVGIILDVMPD
jgi:hypothetical protein